MELMERNTTDKRLDDLNGKVEQGFNRVETDIRSLRAESRAEFAVLRSEIKGESAALRKEIKGESAALRAEMKAGFDSIYERFEVMDRSISERFERTHRLLIQFCGGLFGSFVVAAAALIATQL
jgi:hypothetical protein